ncbi:chromosome segregation protein SMC [Anaerobacillus isosaccharinicus]|uniref:Chromosome partition protein Smc n=1 Tax=Anaerobacillus isosaccharinicus TaxID=1532552 RepID=A0A1S2L8P8_9BACI|nr:chromosome segregation protein SMC [Anaerobacillus isosaccharinicus]MBA5587369.1 chromosome segregation protein SMC [Anaerobacillus isosaccharinicus]QOY34438.1 chromosome segregation protein SMC [Anaerobacillus isosaccharinicus]
MFLKRLDVVGFKSFAERTSIDFVPGVTAVVGPNGSGKSNISDGIRWVLGEQSAKSLRGAKMEDIIFAGSDSRKPLNFAELTLTLNNEDHHLAIDYSEVSVTRRVYRSGESEYYINKQSCRLKDIHELFMDSGLGREAYSIIGQGKIEEILSSKSEERRVIFEEAAGVLKYKTRKQKAERKLAETQENLFRVEDILHELGSQVEPLKIQASMAKDYLEKKDELEKVEVGLLVFEIEELHTSWEEQKKKVLQLSEEQLQTSSKIKVEEVKIEEFRSKMQALDESINDLQDVLLVTSEQLEKREGQKEVLKERKKNYHQTKESLLKKIEVLKEKKQYAEESLKNELEKRDVFKENLKASKSQLEQETSLLISLEEDIETELERMKSDYIEVLNEQASIRNEIRYLEEQLRQRKLKSGHLDSSNISLLEQREALVAKEKSLQEKLLTKQTSLEEHIQLYRKESQEFEKLIENYQKKETQLYQALGHVQQIRSRKEVLEEMQADFAGFFQGVKEILKARETTLKGIEGAVAELITVPKNIELAVETALGGAMQHIVVGAEEDGRQAIQFLKARRLGRATFLPLSVIKARDLPSNEKVKLLAHPAFVGSAIDLIQFEEKYRGVISNLLGSVVIAKDLEGANELAKILYYKNRIVTLDGDVVNPGGSMSGGSVKQKGTPLLGRQRELEELVAKLISIEEQTKLMEAKVKSLKDSRQTKEVLLNELRKEGELFRSEEQQLKGKLREFEIEGKNLNERLSLYDKEKASFQSEVNEIEGKLLKLTNRLAEATELKEQLDEQVQNLTEKKKLQQTSKASLTECITDLKVQVAKEEEQYRNQHERVQAMILEKDSLDKEWIETDEEYWLLEREMSDNTTGEESLDEIIEKKRREKERTFTLIQDRRKERLSLQTSHDDLEKELKEHKRNQRQLSDYLHTEEVKVNRLDVELENRLEKLSNDYEMSFEMAKANYPLTLDAKAAKSKVKLIKLAIDELGTVNIGAIEEYSRVSERYTFLAEQKADLQEAKETLYRVIGEMDEEMSTRFEETFLQIKSHFQGVFQQLFGGGKADLILSNPDNILTTGVEIVAQPPGKNLQNLALLSGGERALTAIALLFAILKVRPVPFCVLDEVEAALDEANVSRFAHFLKDFSKETQFIVVTHRKGTMEEADVLYGVTMQESGVSKLVSVRLEETAQLITT